jgi:hypothetical protein
VASLTITIIAMIVSVVAVGGHWFLTGRLFPRSVSLDVIQRVARLKPTDVEVGLSPLTTYYEWSQDRWSGLAKGAGGAAITTLASVVGLLITTAASTTATEESAEGVTTTVTSAAAEAVPELVVLIVLFLFVALTAWLRAARVHLDFAEDLATLADSEGVVP